eukprot:10090943-Ditylum_brightwellii.AAC.1
MGATSAQQKVVRHPALPCTLPLTCLRHCQGRARRLLHSHLEQLEARRDVRAIARGRPLRAQARAGHCAQLHAAVQQDWVAAEVHRAQRVSQGHRSRRPPLVAAVAHPQGALAALEARTVL